MVISVSQTTEITDTHKPPKVIFIINYPDTKKSYHNPRLRR